MEKAYDIKDLGNKLKEAGLPMAEVAAEQVVAKVIEWVKESAKLSSNPYDDLILVVLPVIEDKIKKELDKIDKKEG